MNDHEVRTKIEEHYSYVGVDETKVHEGYYHEDVIVDFPQGGERIRGKANLFAFRSNYPAHVRITPRRISGSGDLWVHEGTISYDGKPSFTMAIIEFRDGKVAHETIYITDGWEPPAWRAQWVEPMPTT